MLSATAGVASNQTIRSQSPSASCASPTSMNSQPESTINDSPDFALDSTQRMTSPPTLDELDAISPPVSLDEDTQKSPFDFGHSITERGTLNVELEMTLQGMEKANEFEFGSYSKTDAAQM